MPPGRFDLWIGIKIDATRLKPAFALARWRQNGANSKRLLASGAKTEPIPKAKTPLIPLPQPLSLQNDIDFEILWKYFLSAVFAGNERLYSDRPSTPLQQHGGQKKRHGFSKYLSTKLPKPAPLKKRHCFFAFLLRWSSVADSGVIFSALSSTPVPQHPKQKSKHCIETFSSTT